MRFEEGDEREAYRRGVRDCLESLADGMNRRETRKIEAWLIELDAWEFGEPPALPVT